MPPPPVPIYHCELAVVVGLWHCEADHGYGHFGQFRARLDAYTIERVDP